MCYCRAREKFAINFSGSRGLFILNLGCYFHFLKVKKNCQFSFNFLLYTFLVFQPPSKDQKLTWSMCSKKYSLYCDLVFFTKVRMSRLLLWRTQYSKELPRIMPHELFFLWSRTHIFLFLTKVWHESSCLCPLLKVASQTFHLLDLNILSYAHHFWLFRTP